MSSEIGAFWLNVAAELGIDPDKVADGTVTATSAGPSQVLVTWQGGAKHMPADRFRELLEEHWAQANREPAIRIPSQPAPHAVE